MKITRAVIAAAGRGTRFLPVVKQYPKELIAILNKPQLQYLVEELIGAGITDICIIHRHGDPAIKRYFTPDPELEKYLEMNLKQSALDSLRFIWSKVKFKFLPQSQHLPYGNASPVLAAKNFINHDPFIYLFGDDLTVEDHPGSFLSQMMDTFTAKNADAIVAVQPVPWAEISRYGPILFDKNEPTRILDVLEKVPQDQAPSNVTQLGRFVYSPQIINIIRQTPVKNGELWLADANASLAKIGRVYAQYTPQDAWITTGDPLRWLKANLIMGLKDPGLKDDLTQFIKKLA